MDDAGLDHLETARLRLRRFTPKDEALLYRLNSDETVMRYIGGTMDAGKNRAMLHDRILRYYGEHPGLGVWATMVKATGECAGFHLLNHVKGESLIQLGYRLFPSHWGQGYATEMGTALLRYGFVQRGLPRIMANTHPDNLDSQRVLLKCGLQRRGERAYAHPDLASFGVIPYFERGCADWLAERGG
jgi:RimJ/RimL family protein N-acetyltransferase